MSPFELLLELDRLGVRLESHGNRLRYFPQSAVTCDVLAQLKVHKADLLAWLERYEERAAIMELDAGLSRPEAERLAWQHCFTNCKASVKVTK